MKYILISIALLAAIVVSMVACVACSSPSPTPTPSPAPTETPRPSPTPAPSGTPAMGDVSEPGGVEVALTLVTIPSQENIAVVNGDEVSTASYEEKLNRALSSVTRNYAVDWNDPENQALIPSLQEQVLDQVIQRVLLGQLASQEGITIDAEEVEAEIAEIQSQIEEDGRFADWESFLAENGLTDEDVRELVADNMLVEALAERHGGPRVVEHVHASHILVETEETAQEVLDKLAEGEDFADLAAEYSIDPGSKDQGGDLDWFPRGVMVPEFEEVAFSLDAGDTSDPVETAFGYHIIRVHEKEEREMDADLYEQLQQQHFQTWFEEQLAQASIERLYDFQSPE